MEASTLGWIDYLVIAITMCISLSIGIYYRFSGDHQKTTKEYYTANKSMGIVPVGIALMVSFMSAITLLGVSAENYVYGTQFIVINVSYIIGTFIVCYSYLPVFFKLGSISAYEYLEKRFGYGARLAASFAYWIQLVLYSGVVLYAPALALEATTGLSRIWSIVAIGIVCAFYSTIGGMKAVLMTDVFQGILMFVSLFIVIGTATYNAGGIGNILKIASNGGRIELNNISIDPTVRHTWWGLAIGGSFTYISLFGVNQIQVQRMMTLKNLKSARLALWLNWPILTCLSFLTCFSGLAVYSHYYNCDPIATKRISSSDMLMPLYVMDTLSNLPGLPGIFIAGILSAGLSTISAGLNSLSAVTLEDYIKPTYSWYSGKEFSESKSIIYGKILVVFFGITCIALAFAAQQLGGVLQASLTIFGVVGGPLLGIFTLGMLSESANQSGAISGLLSSLAFTLWIAFGQPRPLNVSTLSVSTEGCDTNYTLSENVVDNSSYLYLYQISYTWYSTIGFIITYAVGTIISYLSQKVWNNHTNELDPDLFFPFIAKRIKRKRQHQINVNGNISSDLYVFGDNRSNYKKYNKDSSNI